MPELVRWKEGIVNKLSNALPHCASARKCAFFPGWARFPTQKTAQSKGKDSANYHSGARYPRERFGFDGAFPSCRSAVRYFIKRSVALDALPRKLVVGRCWLYRSRTRDCPCARWDPSDGRRTLDRILPLFDAELSAPVKKWLGSRGRNRSSRSDREDDCGVRVRTRLRFKPWMGRQRCLPADRILVTVAAGRAPKAGVSKTWPSTWMAASCASTISCRTSMKNVWASAISSESLCSRTRHAQGEMVAEIMRAIAAASIRLAIAAGCFTERRS